MNNYTVKKIERILKSNDPEFLFELEIRQQTDKLMRCNDEECSKELNDHINAIIEARAKYLGL